MEEANDEEFEELAVRPDLEDGSADEDNFGFDENENDEEDEDYG